MAMIQGYEVSNSGGNGNSVNAVRVYRKGELIAAVFPSARNPLGYIRQHMKSRYRHDLIRQLRAAGVLEADIDAILCPADSEEARQQALLQIEQLRNEMARLERQVGKLG